MHPLRPLVLALGLGIALAGHPITHAAPPASVSAYYEDANRRFEADDTAGTLIQLKNALQQDPNHLPSRVLLGRALLKSGDVAGAEKELRLARQLRADDSVVLLPLAQALSAQRKFAELIAEIPADRLPPDVQAEVLVERGIAFLETGQLDAAERELRRARDLRPDFARASAGDVLVTLRRGDKQQAAEMADALLEKAPSSAEAWVAKATVAQASRRLEEAVEAFERALALDATSVNVAVVRAGILLDLGKYQQAADALAPLRQTYPRDPEIGFFYAQAISKLGRVDEARKVIAAAAEVVSATAPDTLAKRPRSLLIAGLVMYGNRQYEQAYTLFNAYLQVDRDHLEARKLAAATLIALSKPRDAVELLRPAMIREVPDPQLYAIAGEAYVRSGQHARAAEAFEQALALRDDDPSLRARLGFARVASGDRERGVADVEAAVAGDPDAVSTSLYLGILKLVDRDAGSARDIAGRVLERDPQNLTALNLLASAQAALGDRATARQLYERALGIEPRFRPARVNLARLDLVEGKADAAQRHIAPLMAEDPKNPRLMYEMALVEDARGRSGEAVQWLEKAYAADRTSVAAALRLAEAYLRTRQAPKALDVVAAIQQGHGDTAAVADVLGRAQLATGAMEDARQTFRRLAALVGYDSSRLIRVAEQQLQAGDRDGAWWTLSKAVAGDEGSLRARAGLGGLALVVGNLGDAREQSNELMHRFPDHPSGYALKGDLAMAEGRYDEAVGAYRTALDKGESAALAIRLMQARRAEGRADLAIAELAAWVDRRPDNLVAKRALAEAHAAAGDLLEAKAVYEDLAARSPEDAGVLNNLADIYGTLGDVRSLQLARRAHELAPDNPAVIDTLGWVLVRLGQPEQGLAYLRDAISRLATSGEIRYHIAVALEDLGRKDEAIRELTAALQAGDLSNRADAEHRLAKLRGAMR
jgi:putative PEP-CTERM system TPR-repeat lipoprotein